MTDVSLSGGDLVVDVQRKQVVDTIAAVDKSDVSLESGILIAKEFAGKLNRNLKGAMGAMRAATIEDPVIVKEQPQSDKAPFDPDRQFSQSFREGITPPELIQPMTIEPATDQPIPEKPDVEVKEIPDDTAASGVRPTDGKVEVSSTDEDYKDPTEVIAKEPKQALAQSQALLKETGHYRDTVDGLSGANTTNAVKTFQYENGLEVTGELDLQTRTKLGSGTATKRPEISDSNNPLLSFIAKGESGGYGAANNGTTDHLAEQGKLFSVLDSFYSDTYSKPLEKMTVKEVMNAQLAKSGASMDELLKHVKDNTNKDGQYIASNSELDNREFFAVGAYQIIPLTMAGAINSMGLTGDEVFNQELQDRIAIEYLAGSKRPKLQAWLRGEQNVTRAEAHEELAKEWASIPIGEEVTRKGQTMVRGESYYKPEKNVANAHTAEEVESLLDSLRPKNVGLDVPTTTD